MRILNISAQKPDSTGSGVYLAEMVRCELSAGHAAAVVSGIDALDEPKLPEGSAGYFVRFNTSELPFSVCGMSDVMPYAATRYRDLTPTMAQQFCEAFERRIAQAAADFAPDAVICHHLYLACAIARETLPGIPMAAVCHSTDLRQMRSHGLQRERIIEAVLALDVIFSLHEEQKREIVDLYGVHPGKVRVIGTGYNAQEFFPGPQGPIERDACRMLYVGKIGYKKGVESLIAALDEVAGRQGAPRIEACLVGGHSDAEEYERIERKAAECAVPIELAGKVSQDDLVKAYRESDVFVLPSFFEGLPLVTIEALACGCRAVVTDLPGVRPWLQAHIPGAPIEFVQPPRMDGVDEPAREDLPAFEARLADAIERAALAGRPASQFDVSALSWESLTERAIAALRILPSGR